MEDRRGARLVDSDKPHSQAKFSIDSRHFASARIFRAEARAVGCSAMRVARCLRAGDPYAVLGVRSRCADVALLRDASVRAVLLVTMTQDCLPAESSEE